MVKTMNDNKTVNFFFMITINIVKKCSQDRIRTCISTSATELFLLTVAKGFITVVVDYLCSV